MRNLIGKSTGCDAPSRRCPPSPAASTRPSSPPSTGRNAAGAPLSAEAKQPYCPNCPAKAHSKKAGIGGRNAGDPSPTAKECCGRYLLKRSMAELYRDANGLILMCVYCRRTRRANEASDQWDWVESYVRHMPARVTHGICKQCMNAVFAGASAPRFE